MEVLIFSFGNLLMLALFIGATVSPVLFAHWLGRQMPMPALRWVLPVLTAALPLAWAMGSYGTFMAGCAGVPKPAFFASPSDRVDGFFMTSRHLYPSNFIEKGGFQYIEQPAGQRFRRDFAAPKADDSDPTRMDTEFITEPMLRSRYVVSETEPQPLKRWFMPPIAVHAIEVRERRSGQPLARSTDLVLGGGVLGIYMALLGQDQDFQFLSCGHVPSGAGPWRPTLASRPRFAQYQAADLRFVVQALGEPAGR